MLNEPTPNEFVSETDWLIEEDTKIVQGQRRVSFSAENRSVKMTLFYNPGLNCTVYGKIRDREFYGKIDPARSIGLVVYGIRDSIRNEYGFNGFEIGKYKNPIIMSDRFRIEFTFMPGSKPGLSTTFYFIEVTATKH
ncbi:MAG: hypothetical protein AAGH53_03645 [Pseudomonadota bacterium]